MTRVFLFLLVLLGLPAQALTVHKLISNGAVLQRNQAIPIQGTAQSASVSVWLNDSLVKNVTVKNKRWQVTLPAQSAGGPYKITVKGDNELKFSDIYFGDVFLASGQSNMELTMARIEEAYPEDITNADFPLIREFTVTDTYRFDAENKDYRDGQWLKATPANIRQISAVAFYFARKLHKDKNVPIGIINAAVGGSPIEAWMARETLKPYPEDLAAGDFFADPENITKTQTQERAAVAKWHTELNENDEGLQDTPWYTPELNDSQWKTIDMPGYLSEFNNDFAGVWWLRKRVQLENIPSAPVTLRLGRVVDADEVYINGVKVGNTTYQYPPRRYTVPASALKKGDNLIAVRVTSNGGRSGFVSEKPYYLGTNEQNSVSLIGKWKYKISHRMANTPSTTFIRWKPMGLYNAMIAPATDYPLSGIMWYQGESNASQPAEYSDKLSSMISHWRSQWTRPELPFFIIQLTNFMQRQSEPVESSWAELRNQQAEAASGPNTALIVTIDIGEWNDIHPVNKREVGRRLALAAQNLVYDEKVNYTGPVVKLLKRKNNKLELTFDTPIVTSPAEAGLKHNFAIAGEDGKYVWARAKVHENKVYLHHPALNKPTKVRYAWANNPSASLYNSEGLPARPFELSVNP